MCAVIRFSLLTIIYIALIGIGKSWGQSTTLISPTGDGGFETGLAVPTGTATTDYSANGWTLLQGANNKMWVGTTAVPSAGTYSAFSGTSAASFTGELNANVNHFFRDITFPAGETKITLTFKYKIAAPDGT